LQTNQIPRWWDDLAKSKKSTWTQKSADDKRTEFRAASAQKLNILSNGPIHLLSQIGRRTIRAKRREKENALKMKKKEQARSRLKLKAYRADDPTSPTAAIRGDGAKKIHPLQEQVPE
jgi:hypothetical protein